MIDKLNSKCVGPAEVIIKIKLQDQCPYIWNDTLEFSNL